MKPYIVWDNEDGSPNEIQELSLFWFNVLAFADVLTEYPVVRTLGYRLWVKAFDHAVTVWESESA